MNVLYLGTFLLLLSPSPLLTGCLLTLSGPLLLSFPSSYSSSPLLLIHITYILLHLLFFYLLLLPSKRLQSDRLAARPRPSILSRAHLPTTHESQLSHHEGRAPRTLLFLLLLSSFASASPHLLRDSLRLKLLASIPWLIFLSLPLSLG